MRVLEMLKTLLIEVTAAVCVLATVVFMIRGIAFAVEYQEFLAAARNLGAAVIYGGGAWLLRKI